MDILLATYNNHKIQEIQDIINNELSSNKSGIIIDVINPKAILTNVLDIEENGSTFEENAYIKANAFYNAIKKTGKEIICIADDSGLEVEKLNGNPGIYSARFSGEHGNDSANRKKVIELLDNIPDDQRTARFVASICMIKNGQVFYFHGYCEGKIANNETGKNGFGYDPIFIPNGYTSTFACMDSELKNKLSHRGKAIRHLIDYLNKSCC
jgi:XTP/dITP diphosphohydrolase